MKKRSLFLAIIVACIFSIGLTACSNGILGQSSQFLSYQQMQDEFRESVHKLDWPKGYKVPHEAAGESPDTSYQKGYGDTRASMLFECAWERTWLSTYSSKPSMAEKALQELQKVPSMGYMSKDRADDVTRKVFKDYMNRAKLGDPSGFQQNVAVNCS